MTDDGPRVTGAKSTGSCRQNVGQPEWSQEVQLPATSPRLCFVGSMVGRNPGHITQQGQVLCDLFEREHYSVTSASAYLNRYRRMVDILTTIARQRHHIDMVILEVYGGPSFVVEDAASWLSSRFNIPLVMWLHGGALPEFMDRYFKWARRVLSRADVLVTPTEFLGRSTKKLGFHSQVIPNVIELPAYPFRHRKGVGPRLFWMRSFHETWNPRMAVRVLARVLEDFPTATLVMAGPDKGMENEVKDFATNLGLAGHVRFPGFLCMDAKIREFEAADVYINTNRIDNTPIAVLEASAMGLPVVSTNVGGVPDLLTHCKTGLLVPDDDDRAMAQAIKELVKHSELAESLSRSGRQLARRFSWEQVRPQWDQLFDDLMASRRTNGVMHSPGVVSNDAYLSNGQRQTSTEVL
ncbi:MAG: glycosyltransferase family 4 protein [Pyrinomonadaceae bacterium]|nr:glycosyltransferase family 4 protein [Pyrinomonadaceae bacterium]